MGVTSTMNHLLYIFAIWRVTSLVTFEDGPFDMFEYLRKFLSKIGMRSSCFWCMSVWVALPAIIISIPHWLAYSAAAILLEEVVWAVHDARSG